MCVCVCVCVFLSNTVEHGLSSHELSDIVFSAPFLFRYCFRLVKVSFFALQKANFKKWLNTQLDGYINVICSKFQFSKANQMQKIPLEGSTQNGDCIAALRH